LKPECYEDEFFCSSSKKHFVNGEGERNVSLKGVRKRDVSQKLMKPTPIHRTKYGGGYRRVRAGSWGREAKKLSRHAGLRVGCLVSTKVYWFGGGKKEETSGLEKHHPGDGATGGDRRQSTGLGKTKTLPRS